MKERFISAFNQKLITATLVVCGLCRSLLAADENPTAFALVQEGNRYISEEARDKVVQIESEKSVGSLTPSVWFITYYDKDASLKAVTVKFGAGKKMDVDRPFRLLERANGKDQPLEREKLKTDSDAAIKTAMAEPLLASLTLRATQLWLQRHDGEPQWKVRIWAAKLHDPNRDADVGEVYISTEIGKVVKSDLHIDRVD